jgi:hypothetical protein
MERDHHLNDNLASDTRAAIIDGIVEGLEANYVFPDVAKKMGEHLRQRATGGAYDGQADLRRFVEVLERDLRSICHDRHLAIRVSSASTNAEANSGVEEEGLSPMALLDRAHNHGFEEVRCLPGNVGYLKINEFLEPAVAGPTAVAAMNFLGNTDALIVDLRANGGGWGEMVALVSSYFFSEATHLHTIYIRPDDATIQSWTCPYVQGSRLDKIPIYVLVSRRTASAAEEFADNLKNMKRAVVVGETTKGAAHPVTRHSMDEFGIEMTVPYARSINPITGGNWEGRGVIPDVDVPAGEALEVAQRLALDTLSKDVSDKGHLLRIQSALRNLGVEQQPGSATSLDCDEYVGRFGFREIAVEDGSLVYIFDAEGTPTYPLISMGDDWFRSDLLSYFHLQFVRDDSGQIVGLNEWGESGRSTTHYRSIE